MSDENQVISKEEKRRRKEEKRARKAAKAAASSTAVEASGDVKEKEKKRKRDVEAVPAENGDADKGEKTKQKKKKKEKADGSTSTSAPGEFTPDQTAYLATHNITLQPPSLFPPQLSIASLPVSPPILTFLTSQFQDPTPIQACTWPALLAGRDVVGIAETGSGKTLAFGVPGLEKLTSGAGAEAGVEGEEKKKKKKEKGKGGRGQVKMLVIAPTRELAQQSHETLEKLGKGVGVGSVCIYGGVGKEAQIAALRAKGLGVVAGTPGRILDLCEAGDMDLSGVKYLVLDEADRMLDQGFENDIRRIIGACPGKDGGRQTVMFSATWPESVRRLASTFLSDPIRVTVGSDELSANKRIEQIVEVLDDPRGKDPRLTYHLRTFSKAHPSTPAAPTRILVFALYKKEAQRLEQTIARAGYKVAGLHGDLSQESRFKALDKFKKGEVNVMVATDVAARGLDIPDVGLVINVTFPLTTEDFVHRCGRTGRAGKSGRAVTFFTGEAHERSLAGEFVRVLRDVGAEVPKEMDRFPLTVKKKEHGSYGAFYKDISNAPKATKITFD